MMNSSRLLQLMCRLDMCTCRRYSTSKLRTSEMKSFDKVPGPRGMQALPYVGLRFQFKPFTRYDIRNFGARMDGWMRSYGPIVRVRIANGWNIFLFDPDDIETVFRQDDSKYPARFSLPLCQIYAKRKGQKVGLTSLNGMEWYELRSPAQKCMLRPKVAAKYVPRLSQIADDYVAVFKDKTAMENLPYKLTEFSAESVGMLCFNTRLGCISDSNTINTLMEHTTDYLECFGEHVYHVFPSYMFLETPFYKKFERAADYLNGLIDAYTEKAMVSMAERKCESEDYLLSDLVSTPGMTPDKIQRTIIDVFVGGIDSSANTLTFLFFHLAKNMDKQEKLYKEICENLPAEGHLDDAVLQKLPYMKACIKESMRMVFPVAGGTVRVLDKDIQLQGYHIPKGTTIQMCNSVICRDDKYFSQQDQFIPERWNRENANGNKNVVNPFAYLPFGFGSRKCIGQRFAELEMYICTAKMIQNFRLRLPPGVTELPHKYSTFATPAKPLKLLLDKR